MPEQRSRRSLEGLRKEAKHWLAALRRADPDAQARLRRALPDAPAAPTLRDVQHALAREHGFAGWTELRTALEEDAGAAGRTLAHYESAVDALLEAYRTGTPEALERHYRHTWHRRAWAAMRSYVQLDLGKRPSGPDDDVPLTRDDARHLVARDHGFANWDELTVSARRVSAREPHTVRPVRVLPQGADDTKPLASSRDWEEVLAVLAAHPGARLDGEGQITDGMLGEIAALGHVAEVHLGGSRAVSDDGVALLGALPGLRHLDLSGTSVTDRGLAVLRHLPALETLRLSGTAVTDAGAMHLSHCERLRHVDLSWTATGDGALRALAGKPDLHHFATGHRVTAEGVRLLHEFPVFTAWQGEPRASALFETEAAPSHLQLRGTIGDRGLANLKRLDGLAGLDVDDRGMGVTATGLQALLELPHLQHLALDARDDWMPVIAALPALRYLRVQDTTAGDDGFAALSRSRTLEYLWGRRCHRLGRRGFEALATMPVLCGLSVSCLNVDDAGLAALPRFPALRELMPMDVPDAGYRHVAACEQLESLVLMYCRDTTDAATEHITGLSRLSRYFNSYTTITDRTPALLATMASLEQVTFDACHGLTDAGVAALARLPRLRKLRVSGRQLSARVAESFGRDVRVHWSP